MVSSGIQVQVAIPEQAITAKCMLEKKRLPLAPEGEGHAQGFPQMAGIVQKERN